MQPATPTQNWQLVLAYDGSGFHGWQIQPSTPAHLVPTIQGTLAQAIFSVTGESVLPQGSGRTDTGVHALAQVASFSLRAQIPPENFLRALNRKLPASIRVLSACPVPEGFHARHSALAKTYEYRIFPAGKAICPPFLAPYVYACPFTLDLERLQEAAAGTVGTHDFTSFGASDPDLSERAILQSEAQSAKSCVRTIFSSGWMRCQWQMSYFDSAASPPSSSSAGSLYEIEPRAIRESHAAVPLLIFTVRGTGFLHHMVRNLVGTFVEAGRGHISPADIPQILAARNRAAAGPTAPASGLFLVKVDY